MAWVSLRCVTVVVPDHTHLLFIECFLLYSSFYLSEHEKDILNGIILGVTVVSSIIIFGIIVLFIYKKRHSFRDIIITKTAVAKSNSYKSNVGCKYNIITNIIPGSVYIYMDESF